MTPSRRAPRRIYSLRSHGRWVMVYRATRDEVRASWRRGDVEEMDEAAEEALDWLAAIELRESIFLNSEVPLCQ